jgi:hypothetical protein
VSPLDAQIAWLRPLVAGLPAGSGARWLLACAERTLRERGTGRLHEAWEDWDFGEGDTLTSLTASEREQIGEVALRLGTLADEAPDAPTRAACEDAARGLYGYLIPDDDLGDDPDSP